MDARQLTTRDAPGALPRADDAHCPACAMSVPVGARFCSACGAALPIGEGRLSGVPPAVVLEALQRRVAAGEVREATPALERLCVEYPQWPSARLSLGVAYLRVGRIHEAEDALELAERLAPADFSCEVAFAELHARLGFFDRAIVRLDRALSLTAPNQLALSAAIDLQRYCREHAKKLYYRRLAFPRWPFSRPKRLASRAADLNPAPTRSIEA